MATQHGAVDLVQHVHNLVDDLLCGTLTTPTVLRQPGGCTPRLGRPRAAQTHPRSAATSCQPGGCRPRPGRTRRARNPSVDQLSRPSHCQSSNMRGFGAECMELPLNAKSCCLKEPVLAHQPCLRIHLVVKDAQGTLRDTATES